jgi:hypothetical protein
MGDIVLTTHELGIDLGNLDEVDGQLTYTEPDEYTQLVLSELRGEAHESVLQRLNGDIVKWYDTVVFIQKQVQLRFTALKGELERARSRGFSKKSGGRRHFFEQKAKIEQERTKLQNFQSIVNKRLTELKQLRRERSDERQTQVLWDLVHRAVPHVDDPAWHEDLEKFKESQKK